MALSMMQILDAAADREMSNNIAAATHGHQSVATWCQSTGFLVEVQLHEGRPFFWRIRGPLTRDQAERAVAMEQAPDAPGGMN